MKKLLYLFLLLGLTSCYEIGEKDGKPFDSRVRTTWVNGHEYIVFDGDHKGGIIHSASCPCELKTLEDSIHYFEDGY